MSKHRHYGCAVALVLAMGSAKAAEPSVNLDPPPLQLTRGALTLINLGLAGLLEPLLSEDVFASQFGRMGDSRVTNGYGAALPAGVPQPHYRDLNLVAAGSVGVIKEIPVSLGSAFLRVTASGGWSFGSDDTPLNSTVRDQRVAGQGFYAPFPDLLLGLGVVYDHLHVRSDTTGDPLGSYSTQVRPALGGQFFYAQKFSQYVGLTFRSELQHGTTTFTNNIFLAPGRAFVFGNTADDNRYYNEANLVGSITRSDMPWMMEGWIAHPMVGITYQHDRVQTVVDTLGRIAPGVAGTTEDYGLLMANIRVEKLPARVPGLQFLPRFTVGFEHEYVDSLAEFVHEPNYAVIGAGLAMSAFGQQLGLDYKLREGLHGDRRYQTIALTTSLFF